MHVHACDPITYLALCRLLGELVSRLISEDSSMRFHFDEVYVLATSSQYFDESSNFP